MDIITIINIITAVVFASSVLLKVIAPLTANKKDDNALVVVNKALEILSLHTKKEE